MAATVGLWRTAPLERTDHLCFVTIRGEKRSGVSLSQAKSLRFRRSI